MTAIVEPSSRRFTRRQPVLIALGLVVAAVVAAAVVVVWARPWASSGVVDGGPLKAAGMDDVADTIAVTHAGSPVIWAITTFANDGKSDVVIDSVTMTSKIPGVVTDVVVSASGPGVLGLWRGWPRATLHKWDYRDPHGVVVPPGKSLGIAARLTAPYQGTFRAGPVAVEYHVGERRYRVHDHAYGEICVKPKGFCPTFNPPA